MGAHPPASRKPRDDEIDVYGLTHRGKVRAENQDHFLIASIYKRLHVVSTSLPESAGLRGDEDRVAYVAMVADGVGGGTGGERASATALEAAMQYVNDSMACYLGREDDETGFADALQRAALKSHEAVLSRRSELAPGRRTMATTLTLFLGVWPRYYLLQVGDSRYYRWRDGDLTQVTRDQTFAQELVDAGALTRSDARRSRLSDILSSALGADETAPVVTPMDSDWRNVHLLCSDGLTKHVEDERIAQVLAQMTDARAACEQLLADALAAGGTDNITIVIVRAVPRDAGGSPGG